MTLDLGLGDLLGMEGGGQAPEADPAFHPQSERTPHPARRQREAWSRPCCPKGLSRGAPGPSPSPEQLPDAALGEATALVKGLEQDSPVQPLPKVWKSHRQ